ncbi:hypothetical protein HDE_14095 [Halotydeus destructor]|nr:hypothetical protein HDE_14095 [Halotydeus destructor]
MDVSLLLLLVRLYLVQASRIRDRFDMNHIKATPLRIALPITGNVPSTVIAKSMAGFASIYRKTNFTLQPIASLGAGYQSPNGNYTGLLGELMDNRSDIAVCGTVLSSFIFPDIVPGQPLSSLSLKIQSKVVPEALEPNDVLSSIQKLPLEFIIYLLVLVHIVAGSLVRATEYTAWQYLAASFKSLRFFVKQGDLSKESNARAAIWLQVSVFAFVTVFGYVLNLMSTDSFIMKQSRRIDTFDDVFDPYFRDVRFIMIKNDPFFNYAQQSDKSAIMGKVYEKMEREGDCTNFSTCNLMEFDGRFGSPKQLESFQILKRASVQGGVATFLTDRLVETFLVPCLCRSQPGVVQKLYTGTQVFAEDVMVNLMRTDVDKHVNSYLRYIDSTLFELSLEWIFIGENVHAALDTIDPEGRDMKYLHCIGRRMPEKKDILFSSALLVYKRLTFISAYAVLCAVFVLSIEIMFFFSSKRQNRQKRRLEPARPVQQSRSPRLPKSMTYIDRNQWVYYKQPKSSYLDVQVITEAVS